MSENEDSAMLTLQDPMLVRSSPTQDEPTSLKRPDCKDKIESDAVVSLDETSEPNVDFTVQLDQTGERDVYEISRILNRIYTSTDRSITFDIVCSPKPDFNPKVRIMLVCSNLLHHPVARCSHHRKRDYTTFNEHVVRHKDALAEYVGTATGKLYPERLAILVPLDESGRKSITLDFVCLNSCHKIRKIKLALVFTLENAESGQVLARRVFNIQISKNFKRDMEVAEKGRPAKRPSAEPIETDETPAKQPLLMSPSTSQPSSSKGPTTHPESVEVNIELKLPRGAAQEFLSYSRQFFEAKLYRAKEHEERELMPCLEKICEKLDSLSDTKEDEKKD